MNKGGLYEGGERLEVGADSGGQDARTGGGDGGCAGDQREGIPCGDSQLRQEAGAAGGCQVVGVR